MTSDSSLQANSPIARAEAFVIEAPFVVPYKLAIGTVATTRAILLKLTDASGNEGWGEANPSVEFTGESCDDAVRALRESLLPAVLAARSPTPGSVDAELDSIEPRQLCAKGAVTMALLDLLGKQLRVPVATLLGGKLRDTLPVLWPLSNGTAEDDVRVIEEKLPLGFSSYMLKMGTSSAQDEIRRVAQLEARYGDRVSFIADANQGWTIEQAREFLAGVRGSRLAFVEQPLKGDDVEGMAALARESPLPISADESVVGLTDAARLASQRAARVFSIKSSKNGGPLRAQRIVAVARAFGIRCYMNSMLEFGVTQAASLQHAVTIGNLVDFGHAYMSTLRLAEDPTDFSSFVKNGIVHLPQEAGLGVRVDEDHVRRLTVASFTLQARR
jgi:muconate cycloisomerase